MGNQPSPPDAHHDPDAPRPGRAQPSAGGSAPTFLRLSAGTVYFYFGFLKLFPDLSPAEVIAGETLTRVSGHMVSANTAIWLLALLD